MVSECIIVCIDFLILNSIKRHYLITLPHATKIIKIQTNNNTIMNIINLWRDRVPGKQKLSVVLMEFASGTLVRAALLRSLGFEIRAIY